jgi:geranylgeranyl pyrophosphate synthase
MSDDERANIRQLFSIAGSDRIAEKAIIKSVISHKGIVGSEEMMQATKLEALKLLAIFPESKARDALAELLEYIIERDK